MKSIIEKILEIKANRLNNKITTLKEDIEKATLYNLKKQKQISNKKKIKEISKILNIK